MTGFKQPIFRRADVVRCVAFSSAFRLLQGGKDSGDKELRRDS
jgi:hypothetical protein